MGDVRNLHCDTDTVDAIIADLKNRQDDIVEIYVVTIDRDTASRVSASGKMRNLAFAALSLQCHAIDQLRDGP